MYPGMLFWWQRARAQREAHRASPHGYSCADDAGCGPPGGWRRHGHGGSAGDEGGGFGVRRPLRFLAHKLELNDAQVKALARIMNELKTERAQAEVDQQRTLAAFADAMAGSSLDGARVQEGLKLRADSAARLRGAVEKALSALHELLNEEQRARFAHLLRTGTVLI